MSGDKTMVTFHIMTNWSIKQPLSGLEALHDKTAEFDVDANWIEGFEQAFNMKLDPRVYCVRRRLGIATKSPRHALNEKVSELILEFRHVHTAFKINIVADRSWASNAVPPPPPTVPASKRNKATVNGHASPKNNVRNGVNKFGSGGTKITKNVPQQQARKIHTPPVAAVTSNRGQKRPLDRGQSSSRKQPHIDNEDDEDVRSVHSQDSQADCEELGITYDESFKSIIVKRYYDKFTNGQVLRCHKGLQDLLRSGKLMKFTMFSPLLTAFLRELFEV